MSEHRVERAVVCWSSKVAPFYERTGCARTNELAVGSYVVQIVHTSHTLFELEELACERKGAALPFFMLLLRTLCNERLESSV